MSGLLLAVSAAGVAAMLAVLFHPSLADYAEYRMERAPYAAIAGAEPVFEPRIVEPPADPPDILGALGYTAGYPYGYVGAEHVPEDDSVILQFEDPGGSGEVHAQRYGPGQTFAYSCPDLLGRVPMYQYMGTSMHQGVLSLVLLQFEVYAPDVPCTFPDYLVHTVDIYDAGPPAAPARAGPADYDRATYADHLGGAVIATKIHVDPYPARLHDGKPHSVPGDIRLLSDGSIDVTFSDMAGNSTDAYSANYAPGQTFASSCIEAGDVTYLYVYQYRGTEGFRGMTDMMMVNFAVHTRIPVPCTYPDFIRDSTDALDMEWFDERYDEEVRHLASLFDQP